MGKNPVIFWELASHYSDKSVDFFKKVFDWDFKYDKESTIHYVSSDQRFSKFDGGIFTLRKAKLPFLTIYIKVEDIYAKVKEIEAAGGHIVDPVIEISPGILICLFNEPSGVTFAMIQRISDEK